MGAYAEPGIEPERHFLLDHRGNFTVRKVTVVTALEQDAFGRGNVTIPGEEQKWRGHYQPAAIS